MKALLVGADSASGQTEANSAADAIASLSVKTEEGVTTTADK